MDTPRRAPPACVYSHRSGAADPQRSVHLLRQRLSCVPTSVNGEQLLLPAWDGSITALAGSKSGFGVRKAGDLAPYISETGSGRAPADTTKKLPSSPGPHEKRTPRDTQPIRPFEYVRTALVEITWLSTVRMLRPELVLELKVELMRRVALRGPIGLASKAP